MLPNVKFELEDATNTWSWPDNDFDFIHIRYLIGAIADWGALFQEAFRCCKSGSYFESVEVNPLFKSDDGSINNIAPIQTWNKICRESEKAFGRSLCEVENDTQLLGEAGFVDLQVTDFKVCYPIYESSTSDLMLSRFLLADGPKIQICSGSANFIVRV